MKTSLQNKTLLLIASAIFISFGVNAQSRLPDGTVIYKDGHRQLPNGTVIYPPVYDKKAGIFGSIFGGGNPRHKTMTGNILGSIFGSKKSKSNGGLNPSTGSVLGSIFNGNSKGKPKVLPNGNTVFPGNGRSSNYQMSNTQKDVVYNTSSINNADIIQVPANQQRHSMKRSGL